MKANKTTILPSIPNGEGYTKTFTAGIFDSDDDALNGIVPKSLDGTADHPIYPIKITLKGGKRHPYSSTNDLGYFA